MILYLTLHGMWKIELGNPQNNMGGGGGAPTNPPSVKED